MSVAREAPGASFRDAARRTGREARAEPWDAYLVGTASTAWPGSNGSLKNVWWYEAHTRTRRTFYSGNNPDHVRPLPDGGAVIAGGAPNSSWDGATGPASLWRLNPDGSVRWFYTPPVGFAGRAVADAAGDIYFAMQDAAGKSLVRKVSGSTGARVWDWSNGPAGTVGGVGPMAVDTAGSLIVTAARTSLYDGAGPTANVFRLSGAGGVLLAAYDTTNAAVNVACDPTGAIYVAGTATLGSAHVNLWKLNTSLSVVATLDLNTSGVIPLHASAAGVVVAPARAVLRLSPSLVQQWAFAAATSGTKPIGSVWITAAGVVYATAGVPVPRAIRLSAAGQLSAQISGGYGAVCKP